MSTPASSPPAWQDAIYQVLKRGQIKQVGYVPDAGHAHVIRRVHADPDMRAVVLTTEEEGVALATGAWLGGQRAVLLMQSSGVGNFLTLVTMRGEYAEFNPWQTPMSKATQGAMELMGIRVQRADRAEDVEDTVEAALESAFVAGESMAVLLSQRLIGRKQWIKN
ncbi:MAG: hypothetical protein RLZZ395_2449 [Pseudomonadota bacterium]